MILRREPARLETRFEPPVIKSVQVDVRLHGKYKTKSGNPKGLVVHFTAGRNRKGHEDAINTLHDLAYRGLGAMVMATDGTIFRAQNQMIDDVAFHAGPSKWEGKPNVSFYCLGLEVCCAGEVKSKLDSFGKIDKYISWFGETYYQDEVRYVKEKTDNQHPGFYHKFTEEQEIALLKFCVWQKQINKDFSNKWVIGHDEICDPIGRKIDPGGSLSMTMPEFRKVLDQWP